MINEKFVNCESKRNYLKFPGGTGKLINGPLSMNDLRLMAAREG